MTTKTIKTKECVTISSACLQCGKDFICKNRYIKPKTCSTKCLSLFMHKKYKGNISKETRLKMSKALKGRIAWNKGKHSMTEEMKANLRKLFTGKTVSKETYEINNGIALCKYHHPRKRKEEEKMVNTFQNLIVNNKSK